MIAGFLAALLTVSAPSTPPAAAISFVTAADDQAQDPEAALYKSGTAAIDKGDWRSAEQAFTKVVALKGERADAALYWRAYAYNKLSMRDDALKSIASLKTGYPKSNWVKDARALEVEIRQASGQTPQVESAVAGGDDTELKLLALSGLMNADPDKAIPIIKNMLTGSPSPKLMDRALFVLAQSGKPEARQVLVDIAKSNPNPDLQKHAIRNLGLFGGQESQQTLVDIYSTSQSLEARKAVLQALMLSGDKTKVYEVATKEPTPELRREAIQQLGVMGGKEELWKIYQTEKDPTVRRAVINSLFISGGVEQLGELATKEADPGLRREAIQKLGLTGADSAPLLKNIYTTEKDPSVKRAVLDAYFVQGNAKALIEIAKTEQDQSLKRAAVEKLSVMGGKEAGDYMMELLK
jgi:HEAT repeat protein